MMKIVLFIIVIAVSVSGIAHAEMSASATFEYTYSKAVRDACRAQFRNADDRLRCAQYVVAQQHQDRLIQSQINANNAQAELDRERTEWLRDHDDWPRRKLKK